MLAPHVTTNNYLQKTLAKSIDCVGVGLHTGANISIRLKPASENQGILFIRTDLKGDNEIPARWDHVVDTRLCTMIGNKAGATVSTIEHLMAAFRGADIHNAIVEIDGPEVPIMDGSSAPFLFLIDCAGIVSQKKPIQFVKILKKVEVEMEGKKAILTPSCYTSFEFVIDFDSDVIGQETLHLNLHKTAFKTELSKARTFGFMKDFDLLRSMGLARGASLDNAIAIGTNDEILNKEGLHYKDEFVRHKMLDAIGDTYLAGGPILGHFKGVKAGHAINNRLLHHLFADDSAWIYTELESGESTAPAFEASSSVA